MNIGMFQFRHYLLSFVRVETEKKMMNNSDNGVQSKNTFASQKDYHL